MTINEAHLAYVEILLKDYPDYEAKLYNKKDDYGSEKNPHISISKIDPYSSSSTLHHKMIIELSQLLPFAHIYIHSSDGDIFLSIQDKTYEQLDKEQVQENLGN